MVFLVARAFSSGCAALTGVEAISNGVPAFQKPKSRNAATTLLLLGAIAVSPSDHNIIYVGSGEACIRGNISYGNGVYKSLDGGKTWKNVGLKDSRAIGKVIINPTNPDIAFVAALGHPYGPNTERGIFRTAIG